MMSRFDQVQQKVQTSPILSKIKAQLDEVIEQGQYSDKELTEDKIIDLLAQIILTTEQADRQQLYSSSIELHPNMVDAYFKVLWVVLEEHLGNFAYNMDEQKFKTQLKNAVCKETAK